MKCGLFVLFFLALAFALPAQAVTMASIGKLDCVKAVGSCSGGAGFDNTDVSGFDHVIVANYAAPGDGGGGVFVIDGCVAPANIVTCFYNIGAPLGMQHYFARANFNGDIRQAGAIPDGATPADTAFAATQTAAELAHISPIIFGGNVGTDPRSRYYLASDIAIHHDQGVICPSGTQTIAVDSGGVHTGNYTITPWTM